MVLTKKAIEAAISEQLQVSKHNVKVESDTLSQDSQTFRVKINQPNKPRRQVSIMLTVLEDEVY